jgi:hypothetical protein
MLPDVRETGFGAVGSARCVRSEHIGGLRAAMTWKTDIRRSVHGSSPMTPQPRCTIGRATLTAAAHCKFSTPLRHPVPSRSTLDDALGTHGCGRDDPAAPRRSPDGGGDHRAAFERASGHDTAPSSTGPRGRSADIRRTPGRSRDRCRPQTAATPSSTSAARGFLDAGLRSCECSRVDHSSRSPTRLGASNTGPLLFRRHHSRARLSAQAGDRSRIQRFVTLTDTHERLPRTV